MELRRTGRYPSEWRLDVRPRGPARFFRRGQGEPRNEGIDCVISRMRGKFKLDDSVITFRELTFGVDGADVDLDGSYDLNADVLDFHGALKLEAKVSQTVTGWKHWLLKPVDPFL